MHDRSVPWERSMQGWVNGLQGLAGRPQKEARPAAQPHHQPRSESGWVPSLEGKPQPPPLRPAGYFLDSLPAVCVETRGVQSPTAAGKASCTPISEVGGELHVGEARHRQRYGSQKAPARLFPLLHSSTCWLCLRPLQVDGEMKRVALAVTFLWVLSCSQMPQVRSQKSLQMGMAPDSFDDQYIGCTEEMEAAAPRLLQEERARHGLLDGMWTNLSAVWTEKKKGLHLPAGFRDVHGIALLVYTDSVQPLYRDLNTAVREAGVSRDTYLRTFPFKALHYYLSRALQLLREDCGRTYRNQLYRGVRSIRFNPPGAGPVRFGQFTSSSLDAAVSRSYGNATFFILHSCFGAHIEALSSFPFEKEVLIPPGEVFAVSNVTRQGDGNVLVLHSTNRTCSHFNCAYLGGEKSPSCTDHSGSCCRLCGEMRPWRLGGLVVLIHVGTWTLTTHSGLLWAL
ncbi:ecto-ADP-ribosyltransferase 5-like [Alligator sinensis]|uniref:NAD(P)(+)--arginine ADP-ribosyltransferase n=1 Tax=Alligator sinensis TaxID=38654 RepID=A0A1U7SHT9_ALLSI|nr:ecto-ADP-ribosyltransferase 5-like [Alligator sinensis]